MKLSERIKNKKKFIIGVVIGIVVVNIIGIAGAIAASVASDTVLYDSPTGKKNVKDAIDELYTMSSTHCLDGQICYQNGVIGPTGARTQPLTIYLDPTNLSTVCTISTSTVGEGTSGCMQWYVFKQDNNYYYAILDHNTTLISKYEDCETNLSNDTLDWVSSLNPRLITADEVWEITKATNGKSSWSASTATTSDSFYFEGSSVTGNGKSKYAWLYTYTAAGTNTGSFGQATTPGYWTSTLVTGDSNKAWFVATNGNLSNYSLGANQAGVRPVISIAKS